MTGKVHLPEMFGNMWDGQNRSMNQMHDLVGSE